MYNERPICHDKDWQAQRWAPHSWRPAGEKLHPTNDLPMAFRTCSYCGSIHPEDLLAALKAGATLHGADWKYGWPHKFYVEGIPNINQGQPTSRTSGCVALEDREKLEIRYAGQDIRFEEEDDRLHYRVMEPEGPVTHGKWYNLHFFDVDGPEFEELAALVAQHTGIVFEREGQDIKYKAPHQGYQR